MTLERAIHEIVEFWRAAPARPFPYEEIRQLETDAEQEFLRNAPNSILTADLNEYFSTISGLASGGIRTLVEDPQRNRRMTRYLSQSFFERHSQYAFLEDWDLSRYPTLMAELAFADTLRLRLLELLQRLA